MFIHPIERQWIAEAARLYARDQRLSSQAFAWRILRHPEVRLRNMREGIRPLSRRAVENLVNGRPVKSHILQAAKTFIIHERQVPAFIYEVASNLIDVARADMKFQLPGVPSHSFVGRNVGKFILTSAQLDVKVRFEIVYDRNDRLLIARARAQPLYLRDTAGPFLFLSGYAIQTPGYVSLNLGDNRFPGRLRLNLSVQALLDAEVVGPRPNSLTLHGRRIKSTCQIDDLRCFPAPLQPSFSAKRLFLLSEPTSRLIQRCSDDFDLFDIGKPRSVFNHLPSTQAQLAS